VRVYEPIKLSKHQRSRPSQPSRSAHRISTPVLPGPRSRPPLTLSRSGNPAEREARQAADEAVGAGPVVPVSITDKAEPGVEQAPPIVHRVIAGAGRSLDGGARRQIETCFDRALGDIRIHDDALAAESARAVKARAYAVRQHIVFNSGEYAPREPKGRWLLAHELAHTLQPGAETVVQRFESYEHVALGDAAKGDKGQLIVLRCHEWDFPDRKKPKEQWPKPWVARYEQYDDNQKRAMTQGLTYGEVVALVGDLYASFEDLSHARLTEVLKLIPLVRSSSTTTAEFQKASGGRYSDLALKNVSHFSNVPAPKAGAEPGQDRAGSNMDVWRQQHRLAINWARQGDANMAWGLNAGADHFLSDAFSSGHVRVPRAQLTDGMLKQLSAKVLHDLDSFYGVEVTNARGDKWTAYGDLNLHRTDRKGLAVTVEALNLSKKDVAEALAKKMAYPDPDQTKSFDAEKLVPKAVDAAKNRWTTTDLDRMMREVLAKEAPGGIWEKIATDDNLVADWVSETEALALGRQPLDQKIRMLKTLIGGIVTEKDIASMERILNSVPSASEMNAIRTELMPKVGFVSNPSVLKRLLAALNRTP